MSQVLYTADLHFRHALVAGLRGYGDNFEAHDAAILDVWNKQVRDDDIVYLLGDLTGNADADDERWLLNILRYLPGRKRMISGNHDGTHPMYPSSCDPQRMAEWYEVFEQVTPFAHRQVGGRQLMLSHFPYDKEEGELEGENNYVEWRPADTGRWLIHGHTHRPGQTIRDHQIHVGFDAWSRFVEEGELLAMIDGFESAMKETSARAALPLLSV